MEIVKGFSFWLSSRSYSSSTIRNYLSDVNRYFNFVETLPVSNPLSLRDISLKKGNFLKPPFLREVPKQSGGGGFHPDSVSAYIETIKADSNYPRYLSSLSKFFQYALDQNLIKIDPLKQAQKVKKPSTDDILSDYQSFLTKKHFSVSTIRNYLNDIRQFIDWSQNPPTPTFVGSPSLEKGGLVNKIFKNKKFPILQGGMSRRDKGVLSEPR